MAIFALPRPKVGDAMERKNLNSRNEEAAVLSIINNSPDGEHWQAVLFTRNGAEFISSDKEHRSAHDWRPKGWVFDDASSNWVPPGTEWDEETNTFVKKAKRSAKKVAASKSAVPAAV